ncbi:MAG: ABC transporter substrate-binding protein [Clostridia bacterium]|nr:ABC transporter substrate-binding protein [Clostridia bacterium]
MKKAIRLIATLVMAVLLVIAFAGCTPVTEKAAQGVDTENHIIYVGNTAATTGAFASVGVPFNEGLKAFLWYYTEVEGGYHDAEGNQYTIEFLHYDDGFDAANGTTYTEKLVEDDEVFALVGHFGSNTVAATVDYIEAKGIPMVYGVCGVPQLYKTERNVMTIQPIYNTEGRSMLATAVSTAEGNLGLGGKKIGVIATTDEAGGSIKAGVMEEATALGLVVNTNIFYYDVDVSATDFSAAVEGLKAKGCDVVIIAANQAPFINIANQFVTSNYDNVDILTSYVSANYNTMSGLLKSGVITATREIYAGAWLVTGSAPSETKGWADFMNYCEVMTKYDKHMGNTLLTKDDTAYGTYISYWFNGYEWASEGVSAYFLNSYAMAGAVAGYAFTQGLERVDGKVLSWKSYIDAMETSPIDVLMGTSVDYANGQRIGIDALAVSKYTVANYAVGEVYRQITGLADIEAGYKK